MKSTVSIIVVLLLIIACSSSQNSVRSKDDVAFKSSDTVRIANEEAEYEVIIIDPGFNSFLNGQARPRGYYSENFLEQRNQLYVNEWNIRASQPLHYNTDLYMMRIDYSPQIRYGYEVNYLMYNYFIYFQLKYKQQLGGFVPRI